MVVTGREKKIPSLSTENLLRDIAFIVIGYFFTIKISKKRELERWLKRLRALAALPRGPGFNP